MSSWTLASFLLVYAFIAYIIKFQIAQQQLFLGSNCYIYSFYHFSFFISEHAYHIFVEVELIIIIFLFGLVIGVLSDFVKPWKLSVIANEDDPLVFDIFNEYSDWKYEQLSVNIVIMFVVRKNLHLIIFVNPQLFILVQSRVGLVYLTDSIVRVVKHIYLYLLMQKRLPRLIIFYCLQCLNRQSFTISVFVRISFCNVLFRLLIYFCQLISAIIIGTLLQINNFLLLNLTILKSYMAYNQLV